MKKQDKYVILKAFAKEYAKQTKKQKGNTIQEVIRLTGYHQKHIIELLNHFPKEKQHRRNKPSSYIAILPELKKLWKTSNYCCGQLLVAAIPQLLPVMKRTGDMIATSEQEQLLLQISSATINRLLKPERKKLGVKGRSGTKPGTLLKRQIPVRIYTSWNEQLPGFLEIDLVAHCGDSLRGEYINTLDCIDLATCWSEKQALMGKSELYTRQTYEEAEKRFPFSILGIDSDNGSEFINWHFLRLAQERKITFTRSRPFRKNDQAHVEQKNYSTVRKIIGYKRLTTERELGILNHIYQLLSDYHNFFIPTMKLERKERIGSRIKRVYGKPKTPYQRVLEHPKIPEETKDKLKEKYQTLDPVKLLEEINRLVEKLLSS